jgi:Tfp pilus assembly protein PilF
MRERVRDPAKLLRSVEFALRHGFEPDEVRPMLEELVTVSQAGSAQWVFAHRTLAEVLLEHTPWRAATAARIAAAHSPEDDGACALLALALTLLGHYRAAAKAYTRAIAIAPQNPGYAHNLGHLLDVALGRPVEAVPLLRRAHRDDPHVEIAASLAHALARVGKVAEGKRVLKRALGRAEPTEDQAALLGWLEQGAPTKRADARVSARKRP